MSWKPEIGIVENGETKFYQNGQTFATKEEAEKSAHNRWFNWTLASDSRAVEVPDLEYPVNYKWVDGVGDVRLDMSEPKDHLGSNIGTHDV